MHEYFGTPEITALTRVVNRDTRLSEELACIIPPVHVS